jgi:hypothetical protein
VRIPIWLTLGVALLVSTFGAYRIWLGLRTDPPRDPDEPPPSSIFGGGMYRMSKRAHLAVGAIYLLLGAALVATSFGWNPIGGMFGPTTEEPTKDNAPVKPGTVPIDQPPGAKKAS